jgi:hypothetical protein
VAKMDAGAGKKRHILKYQTITHQAVGNEEMNKRNE